jgi:hypothetical protein
VAAALAGIAVAGTLLAGCGSEGADVNCSLNDCTVTFDRGVDASASVLGVDVKLDSVQNDQVTLNIEGNDIQVPVGGEAEAQAGGLQFRVDSVTDDKVIIKVSR